MKNQSTQEKYAVIDFATANVQIRVGENDYTAKVLVAGTDGGV